jgi:hypothetical protein
VILGPKISFFVALFSLGLERKIFSSFSLGWRHPFLPNPSKAFQNYAIGDQAWIIEASWTETLKKKRI